MTTWREFAHEVEKYGRIVDVQVEFPDPGFEDSDRYGMVPRAADGWARVSVTVESSVTGRRLRAELELPRTELGDLAEDWRNGRWGHISDGHPTT